MRDGSARHRTAPALGPRGLSLPRAMSQRAGLFRGGGPESCTRLEGRLGRFAGGDPQAGGSGRLPVMGCIRAP